MADSIVKGVAEEIGELGKKTGQTVVKEVKETGKGFVKAFIGMADAPSVSREEFLQKNAKQTTQDQKKLANIRRSLQKMSAAPQTEPSLFEQKKQEEIWKKQRQVELVKQKQLQQLPKIASKTPRGNLLAVKKRKEAHVEMGKTPGQ